MEYYKNLDLSDIKYFCEFDLVWKTEEWKDVVGYETVYSISDLGRLKSLSRTILNNNKYPFVKKEKILKQSIDNHGYCIVGLYINNNRKTRTVHQMVAVAFLNHIICGVNLVVNHKNFIKTDNRKLNFEIVTSRENSNKKHLKSASKYVGVSWCNSSKKWRSRIGIKNYRKHLGLFETELQAHEAYQIALKNL